MKVVICVGSVDHNRLPEHQVVIDCDDYEDLIECLLDCNDGYEYCVAIGSTVFKSAHYNEHGCYGDVMSNEDIVHGVRSVFKGEILK